MGKLLNKARATCCNFFLQVSADNSAEKADHIEKSGAVSMQYAAVFSAHLCGE